MGGAAIARPLERLQQSGDSRRLERIGIQLYSVRTEMERDVGRTLERLARIGYREVEFAGYFGHAPNEIRSMLLANGLTAPSAHIPYDDLKGRWDKALDDAVAIGHEFVTIPWLAPGMRDAANWDRLASEFNTGAERARARGLRFAYHNHDFDFHLVSGRTLLDTLLERTDPALVSFELDVYWAVRAGRDPVACIRNHPTRFAMLHIKDSSGPPEHRMVDVGAGTIDFAAVLREDARLRAAVKHVFVEHDQPADPLAFAQRSFDYLSQLNY